MIKELIALPFYSMFGCSNEEVSWVGVGDLILRLIINNIFYTNMIDPIHPDLLPVFTFGVCSTTDGQKLTCRYAFNNFLITYIVSLLLNEDSGLDNNRNTN